METIWKTTEILIVVEVDKINVKVEARAKL